MASLTPSHLPALLFRPRRDRQNDAANNLPQTVLMTVCSHLLIVIPYTFGIFPFFQHLLDRRAKAAGYGKEMTEDEKSDARWEAEDRRLSAACIPKTNVMEVEVTEVPVRLEGESEVNALKANIV